MLQNARIQELKATDYTDYTERSRLFFHVFWRGPEFLANFLGRPHKSVKASMNARLAMAIANAQTAVFGTSENVVGLFIWRQNSHGIWEMSMTQKMREAIAIVSKGDFAILPSAD